jgi:hypothetical protein
VSGRYWTAQDLLDADLPPARYAVDRLVPEGLTLLVGSPKVGKSCLALSLAVAVAAGGRAFGTVAVDPGDVLYLALEDGPRRLRDRLVRLVHDGAPGRLAFVLDAPRVGEGLVEELDRWANSCLDPRMVVIDVLARVKPHGNGRAYDDDYASLAGLQQWATDRGIAVLVVHHTRKAHSDDYLGAVSGTHGLAGAADAVLVLTRPRTERRGLLAVTGRDLDEAEYALDFDAGLTTWRTVGAGLDDAAAAGEVGRATAGVGDRMAEVVTFVHERGEVTATVVAKELHMSNDAAGKYLRRAAEGGRIVKAGRGTFRPPDRVSEVSEVSETGQVSDHSLPVRRERTIITQSDTSVTTDTPTGRHCLETTR